MIRGVVNGRGEAVITLEVRGMGLSERKLDLIVDSGYSGTMSLPTATVSALGLAYLTNGQARLADGSELEYDIYIAEVLWDGAWERVLVSAFGPEALIGMQLLAGHELRVEVVPGGAVEIARLP